MKIALAQTNQTVTDIENNKNKIISFANNAYKKGAEVVIFANNSLRYKKPLFNKRFL